MSSSTFSVSKAQAKLPALCRSQKTTPITKRGEVVAFIVPKARMQSLFEQMEILANTGAMKAIKRAKSGKCKNHPLSALDEN